MLVEKKVCINLDDEELDAINRFIQLKKNFHDEDVCAHLSCCDCPMEKLCDVNVSDAYEFQDMINECINEY